MSSLDDRERGYESKFAADEAREFRALARRNRMLGEWAGGLMGLDHPEDYAKAIVKSEIDQPSEADMLRRVHQDLTGAGLQVSQSEVTARMDEFLAIAREKVAAGD